MKIYIDADACPVVSIAEKVAAKFQIPVTLLCDTNHILQSDYSDVIVVDAGADAVKFQTFKAQNLVCKNAGKAAYQLETTEQAETQYEMLKKLELTEKMHEELVPYCRERGIEFLSTPFDVESVDLLLQYEIPLIIHI